MIPRSFVVWFLSAPLLLLVGCTAAENYVTVDDLRPTPPPRGYLIQPGDELDVRFFHLPQLNTIVTVRPDGMISLPYAIAVKAADRTPEEVSRDLVRDFERILVDPEIAVIVRTFSSYRIHVGGRVVKPGVYPLAIPMTVIQAIEEAGGHQPEAWLSQVLVIRKTPEGGRTVINLDIWDALEGRDLRQDLLLQPRDIVYVPDAPIAHVNIFVDLYIRKNIPFDFGYRVDLPF